MKSAGLALTLCLLLTLWSGALSRVAAHGGGTPQLVNAPVGAFLMTAWTSPAPLRVGVVHVTVALAEAVLTENGAQPGEPALGQSVQLTLTPPAGGNPVIARLTHDQAANKLFYEADVSVSQAGNWLFSLVVNGESEQHFSAQVENRQGLPSWAIAAPLAALVLAVWIRAQRRRT